jgi:hypothetical protein
MIDDDNIIDNDHSSVKTLLGKNIPVEINTNDPISVLKEKVT